VARRQSEFILVIPMGGKSMRIVLCGWLILCCWSGAAFASQVNVAVASNFLVPLQSIAKEFEANTGHELRISAGSTGKLYAQIVNGAPFDVFLAANSKEPQRLEVSGAAIAGSRFTYGLGQLVLWAPQLAESYSSIVEVLTSEKVYRLAVANPTTAPYGAAAIETLKKLGVYDDIKNKIIRGENVSQTYQYVASGAAQIGFVAKSQIISQSMSHENASHKTYWTIDGALYSPIQQQAVLLKRAENNAAARQFLEFLQSREGRAAITSFGYGLVDSGLVNTGLVSTGLVNTGLAGNGLVDHEKKP
jgi:molybdate transport system substrate-binding protein